MKAEGAKEIVSIMKNNITLRELFIGGNEFKEEGGNSIASGILSNRSITTLDLGIFGDMQICGGTTIEKDGMRWDQKVLGPLQKP